jgi:hypothetical protein
VSATENVVEVQSKTGGYSSGGMHALAQFEQVFDKLCKGSVVTDLQLRMQGRVLHVPQAGMYCIEIPLCGYIISVFVLFEGRANVMVLRWSERLTVDWR